ncbi:MAG TPA: hypothetical protein VFO85_13315, partial [Vicinamibacteria bacterium]|nr:hypothetical protein [Vicinamibacteria bacterium]
MDESQGVRVMKRGRRWLRLRTTGLPLAVGMVALLGGGSPARMAPPPGVGIDPLEVLDQQVKHNVLIVLDTSRTMKAPFDRGSFSVGGDDPASRFYQVKQALKAAVTANQARANIGLATFNVLDADKTVNRTQDLEGDTRADGPFIYVSADAGAAGFFTNQLCAATGSSDGFFCNVSDVFDDYNDPVSAEIFRSFSNVGGPNQLAAYDPYPAGCTPGTGQLAPVLSGNTPAMRCRYYMQSRLLRNGMRYIWDRAAGPAGGTETPIVGGCPAPPAGLLSHPGTPACFQLQDGSLTGAVSTFYYSSAIFQDNTASPCAAGAVMAETDNGSCTGNAPATLARLELELPLADIPPLPGNATFTYGPPGGHLDGDQTIVRGLRADQDGLPIKATLDFIHTTGSPVFPGQADPAQRNFVILVTAGDESCANPDPDLAAVAAADAAENLLNGDPTDFRRTATTIVVGIGGNASPPRLDAIAQGGSGAFIDGSASGPGTAVTGCRTGAPCFNALMAQDTRQLTTAIDAALERAGATGIFSAT